MKHFLILISRNADVKRKSAEPIIGLESSLWIGKKGFAGKKKNICGLDAKRG